MQEEIMVNNKGNDKTVLVTALTINVHHSSGQNRADPDGPHTLVKATDMIGKGNGPSVSLWCGSVEKRDQQD